MSVHYLSCISVSELLKIDNFHNKNVIYRRKKLVFMFNLLNEKAPNVPLGMPLFVLFG